MSLMDFSDQEPEIHLARRQFECSLMSKNGMDLQLITKLYKFANHTINVP